MEWVFLGSAAVVGAVRIALYVMERRRKANEFEDLMRIAKIASSPPGR